MEKITRRINKVVGLLGPNRFFAAILVVFVLATPSSAADNASSSPSSFSYSLAGIARFDGVAYASFFDRTTRNSLLLKAGTTVDGWKLVTIETDNDPAGPSATIEKDGTSLHLAVESFASEIATQPAPNIYSQLQAISAVSGLTVTPPQAPAGGTLPLIFQSVDAQKLNLSADEVQAIKQLRHDFLSAVNATSQGSPSATISSSGSGNATATNTTAGDTPSNDSVTSTPSSNPLPAPGQVTPAQQLKSWQKAQQQSDELLRTVLGWQAFNDYQKSLLN